MVSDAARRDRTRQLDTMLDTDPSGERHGAQGATQCRLHTGGTKAPLPATSLLLVHQLAYFSRL